MGASSFLSYHLPSGAVAGGAHGAAVNPQHVFRKDTRGYCYRVDKQGNPVFDEEGQVTYDYVRP